MVDDRLGDKELDSKDYKKEEPSKGLIVNNKKRILIVTIVAVLLLSIGILLYLFFNEGSRDARKARAINNTVVQSEELFFDGQIEEAKKLYDEAIDSEKDSESRDQLISGKVALLINTNNYKDALNYALELYEKSKTIGNTAILAQVYAGLGDKDKAIKYYQEVIAMCEQSESSMENSYADYYRAEIEALNEKN